ncbi:MAG: UbiD family decarboxylase [Firmicutes bacterium]|nr:UbiD family decarboxylase [Bacillota bacterium]
MPIKDLRSFLTVLSEKGQLVTVEPEVNPVHEIGSILATLERKNGPAAFFRRPRGATMPVVGGLLASPERIALALNCSKSEVPDRIAWSLEHPLPPEMVTEAPFAANRWEGDAADLSRLPIPTHAPGDSGPFITAGVVISRDPDTGVQNLSFQRMQVQGPHQVGIMINEWRHLKGFLDKAESRGQALPLAVAVGVDPVLMIAAGLRYEGDEMEVAGALRGSPVPVVRSEKSGLLLPALAEIILEGEIPPGVRAPEGPLAEFTGHYGRPWQSPVFLVQSISCREGAIYQTLNGASFEHINLGNVLPREPLLKHFVSHVSKNVKAVHLPPYGSGFLALVAVEKRNPGEPKNLALAAMTAHVNIKNVIVVDPDVNIYDPADVLWALSTRVRPEEDIFYVKNAQGHELDPTSDSRGVQTKMGIDATISEDRAGHYKKVVYSTVDLSLYGLT